MRKTKFSMMAVVFAASVFLMSSCIGSFALSKGILRWNNKVTNNKFVNEIVFLALWIFPVYGFSIFADAVLFNSIEFWTGSSILNANVDQTVKGEKGEYHVKSNENGYTIEHLESGEVANLNFDKESQVWSIVQGDKSVDLIRFVDENNVQLFYGDKVVNLDNSYHLTAAN